MLHLEHSAILLTCALSDNCIVLKTNFSHFKSGGFTQVLLYNVSHLQAMKSQAFFFLNNIFRSIISGNSFKTEEAAHFVRPNLGPKRFLRQSVYMRVWMGYND